MPLAYVLQRQPWRETSLLVEIFSRDHGRLGLLAKGARRPHSPTRGLLQAFQLLDLRYGQKGELRTLLAAEWRPPGAVLPADRLMPGFYLNELVIQATLREHPDGALFDAYHEAMLGLAQLSISVPVALRWLECRLLAAAGVAPWADLESELAGSDDARVFAISPQQGLRVAESGGPYPPEARPGELLTTASRIRLLAESHLPLAEFHQRVVRSPALGDIKRLLQGLLAHHLGRETPSSRHVARDLDQFRQRALRSRSHPIPS